MPNISEAFPPKPRFTEQQLPDQSGRVFFITGAAVGVGYQLAKILYAKNGVVYIATRSKEKIDQAIASIKQDVPFSKGRLEPLLLDLADLQTIKPAIMKFLEREQRLDVLVLNAGVMTPPKGSLSKQGHDLEMSTNALGPFLIGYLLQDILVTTSQMLGIESGEVRTVWLSSFIDGAPKGVIVFDEKSGQPKIHSDPMENYLQSKAANVYLAHEFAERIGEYGVISMSVNPGLIKTELQRHMNPLVKSIMGLVFKPAIYGAYSELFAGFSPDVTLQHNGGYCISWGRHAKLPENISVGLRSKAEGGTGNKREFWDWCIRETKLYV